MKITAEHYKALEAACMETIKAHELHPDMVQSTAVAWSVFIRANYENRLKMNDYYALYNDEHINTALRKIFSIKRRATANKGEDNDTLHRAT